MSLRDERAKAMGALGERHIWGAVVQAVEEEFGGTYGGSSIAERVLQILYAGTSED